ncbi:MAG: NAD(P)H-binding protein [Acidobacteria bacterium]|nr:NAD(P)H-binding protein [Acidobacteriota bacterium]
MVLVTGATGNVGGELVRQLAAAGEPVRALVRSKRGADKLPSQIEVATGDLDRPESLAGPLECVQRIFLLGGHRDMLGLMAQIQRTGVRHVVLLSSRSVLGGSASNAIVRMWRASEEAVGSSGVPWTILRSSGFMSNALEWAQQIRAGDVVRGPFPNVLIAAIDPYDIAAVAAVVLSRPEHEGHAYILSGPKAILPADRMRILANVLGRNLRFEGLTEEETKAELRKSNPEDFVEAFLRFFAEGEFDDSEVLPTVQEITGRAPRSFEDWARAHEQLFR